MAGSFLPSVVRRFIWWAVTDSNRRHSACKADALPTELTALAATCIALWRRRASLSPIRLSRAANYHPVEPEEPMRVKQTYRSILCHARQRLGRGNQIMRLSNLTLAFLLAGVTTALAQQFPPQPAAPDRGNDAERAACRPDVVKFCQAELSEESRRRVRDTGLPATQPDAGSARRASRYWLITASRRNRYVEYWWNAEIGRCGLTKRPEPPA